MSYRRGGDGVDEDDPFEELREQVGNPMWSLFRDYAGGYRFQFVVGALATIGARLVELVPPLVLGIAIDAVFRDDRPYELPLVPEAAIPADQMGQFWLSVGLIFGAYLLVAVLSWANSWAWNHFAQNLQHEIRTETYGVVQRLDVSFFDDQQTGQIMSVLNNDVNQLETFFTRDLNNFIRIVVLVFGVGFIMVSLNWQLSLVALLSVPFLALASYVFVRIIKPKYQRVRSRVGSLNSRLENNISGILVIKAFNRERFEHERVEESSEEYLNANWDAISTRIKFFPSLRIIAGGGFAVTFLVGGYWLLEGPPGPFTAALSVGMFVTFLMYTERFLWPMRQFGEIINDYQYTQAAAERVYALMADPPSVADDEDATDVDRISGHVEYEGVSFGYDDENVLADVSFEVEPGQMVGLVGPTGAGKTTLVKLLMRFYDVDEGAVRVDGHDVRELSLSSLRGSIGYVSQEPFLFHGTVRENVAYGRPNVSEDEIVSAVRRAGAWEFIRELPDGLDTTVGERGVKLSGGQRQRISIARAILDDPDILVLDEATSHVDNETEVIIQQSLDRIASDRTTFAIAHRLSTVRNADLILVLEDGEIVEHGDHHELLENDGLYANLWRVHVGEVDDLPEEFVRAVSRRADLDD